MDLTIQMLARVQEQVKTLSDQVKALDTKLMLSVRSLRATILERVEPEVRVDYDIKSPYLK